MDWHGRRWRAAIGCRLGYMVYLIHLHSGSTTGLPMRGMHKVIYRKWFSVQNAQVYLVHL